MKGIVETVAGVIERLSISSTEKKRLKQELETLLVDYEREHLQVQSGVLIRTVHFLEVLMHLERSVLHGCFTDITVNQIIR